MSLRKFFSLILVVGVTFLLTSKELKAEESNEQEVFDLGEIVVTATKTPHLLKDVPASVTVISRDEIEKINALDAGNLLGNVAGVKIERYGGMGASASVIMRGLLPNKVLVLVDSRPINSPSLGSADLSWLSVDNIERVEIVRGPVSALYGANGVAGVVNIITKSPSDEPTTKFATSHGAYNTSIFTMESSKAFNNFKYLIYGNYKDSDGERDNSEYESKELNTKFEFKEGRLMLSAGFYDGKVGNPGVKPAKDVNDRFSTQIAFGNDEVSSLVDYTKTKRGYLNALLNRGGTKLQAYLNDWEDDDHREWLEYSFINSRSEHHLEDSNFKTKVYGTELQNSLELNEKNILTFGGSIEKNKFKVKKGDYNADTDTLEVAKWDAARTTMALYLEDEISFKPLTLNLGIRWDNPSDYDSQLSPKASLVYRANPNTALRASYGKAFSSPSLNDLNWPSDPFSQGNPNLQPEKSDAYELGLEKLFGEKILLRASLFRQDVEDMIAWQPTGPPGALGPKWQPSNVDKAEVKGAEIEGKTDFTKNLNLNLRYTYLDAKQKNMGLVDYITNKLEEQERTAIYIPRHKIDLNLEYKISSDIERDGLNLNVQYISKTYNYYANYHTWPDTAVTYDTKRLSGYVVVNVKLTRRFKDGEFFFAIDNLFDEKYAKFGGDINDQGYPMPGASISGGVKVGF